MLMLMFVVETTVCSSRLLLSLLLLLLSSGIIMIIVVIVVVSNSATVGSQCTSEFCALRLRLHVDSEFVVIVFVAVAVVVVVAASLPSRFAQNNISSGRSTSSASPAEPMTAGRGRLDSGLSPEATCARPRKTTRLGEEVRRSRSQAGAVVAPGDSRKIGRLFG